MTFFLGMVLSSCWYTKAICSQSRNSPFAVQLHSKDYIPLLPGYSTKDGDRI